MSYLDKVMSTLTGAIEKVIPSGDGDGIAQTVISAGFAANGECRRGR
ncbi:hypothetical protein [Nocardia arizonensis]|nr:hypothetical protein [Nocardia arizonensis]